MFLYKYFRIWWFIFFKNLNVFIGINLRDCSILRGEGFSEVIWFSFLFYVKLEDFCYLF